MHKKVLPQFILISIIGCLAVLISTASKVDAQTALPIALSEFPPFEFQYEETITGFDTEIVEQVLLRAGYKAELKILPWARALKYVKDGKVAAIYSLTRSPERESFCYFSEPVSRVRDVFFKLKTKKINWNTMNDLRPYRVGISRGYTYAHSFMAAVNKDIFNETEIISGDSLELRNLKKVKAGYIDICICEISVCMYLINKYAPEFDMIDHIDKPIGEIRPYYIGFSKKWPGSPEIVQKFNDALKKFVAEGKRKEIFKKYGVADPF